MPDTISIRVKVSQVSLETLSEAGWEPGDDGSGERSFFELDAATGVMNRLTRRQRLVAEMLAAGYTRRETAQRLGISLQVIYQIVPRMRKRLS